MPRLETPAALLLLAVAGLWPVPAPAAETIGGGDCRVSLLVPGDEGQLPSAYSGMIAQPYDSYRLAVREALAQMPPLTCAAVQRLVFVHTLPHHAGEEGWVDPDDPDLVNINIDTIDPVRRAPAKMGAYYLVKTMQAILHESTHAADFLLYANGAHTGLTGGLAGADHYKKKWLTSLPEADDWPAGAQQMARKLVQDNRLGGSLRAEWQRIQRAFIAFDLGGPYRGPRKADEKDDNAQLAKDGFTSRYGATSVGEDIAEFAAWMLAAPLMTRSYDGKSMPAIAVDNYACRTMQAHPTDSVPANLALLFTKANLLLSAGLVTQQAFDTCVGKLRLHEPGEGVFVWEFIGSPSENNVQLKRNFKNDLSATIGTNAKLGQYVFALQAGGTADYNGKEYPAVFKLHFGVAPAGDPLETVSWPRGIYDLDALGNGLSVELPDVKSGTFVSTKGVILVGYATDHRIDGSVFLQGAFRPFAPLAVPQTGMPMRFTFSVQK